MPNLDFNRISRKKQNCLWNVFILNLGNKLLLLQWCWWQRLVWDNMIVLFLKFWWQIFCLWPFNVVFTMHLTGHHHLQTCHQHNLSLVSVTKIQFFRQSRQYKLRPIEKNLKAFDVREWPTVSVTFCYDIWIKSSKVQCKLHYARLHRYFPWLPWKINHARWT